MIGDWRTPAGLEVALSDYLRLQNLARGDWPSPREQKMPNFPYPAPDNPVLEMLVADALRKIEAGGNVTSALTHLATHAWFEGGIEGYDRGRRDGAEPGTR